MSSVPPNHIPPQLLLLLLLHLVNREEDHGDLRGEKGADLLLDLFLLFPIFSGTPGPKERDDGGTLHDVLDTFALCEDFFDILA